MVTVPNRISHCERHLVSSHPAATRSWLRRLAEVGAGAIVVGLLATAGIPTASAQAELADWLSKAIVPVSAIHTRESDALAVIVADPRDVVKLKTACTGLDDARRALQGQMPTPDERLTVEVQQAIDNFETLRRTESRCCFPARPEQIGRGQQQRQARHQPQIPGRAQRSGTTSGSGGRHHRRVVREGLTRTSTAKGIFMNRLLSAAVAAASTALLITGCTQPHDANPDSVTPDPSQIAGKPITEGPSGLRPGAPGQTRPIVNTDNGEIDHLAAISIADIEEFWTGAYGEPLKGKFTPVNSLFSYDLRYKHGTFCGESTSKLGRNAQWCGEPECRTAPRTVRRVYWRRTPSDGIAAHCCPKSVPRAAIWPSPSYSRTNTDMRSRGRWPIC